MRLLISDANILIDMDVGGLIGTLFRLERYRFAVPDVLFVEELKDQHPDLLALGLEVLTLESAAVTDAEGLLGRYGRTGVSRMDILALALARQEGCPLLSGDRRLREAAEAENVEVMGTLWLMDRLVACGVLELASARRAYKAMKLGGGQLPWAEVERQFGAAGPACWHEGQRRSGRSITLASKIGSDAVAGTANGIRSWCQRSRYPRWYLRP